MPRQPATTKIKNGIRIPPIYTTNLRQGNIQSTLGTYTIRGGELIHWRLPLRDVKWRLDAICFEASPFIMIFNFSFSFSLHFTSFPLLILTLPETHSIQGCKIHEWRLG
ncbi:hypothetical protein V8C43DRAFT_160125 [Trichoderma afarasin]